MSQSHIPEFNQTRITVVGDVMLDRYWHGQTGRISPEAPVPVVHVKNCEARAGGAGNVALNLDSLGCQIHLFGICGDDENGIELKQQFANTQIQSHLLTQANYPTCTKLRVISRNQQLVRLDFEQIIENNLGPDDFERFSATLTESQVLILSDYGKGTINQASDWIQAAKAKNIPVLVDPKGHDFARYQGATLITPNLKEFELVVGPCPTEEIMIEKARVVINNNDLDAILVTRGQDGMMLVCADGEIAKFPAVAREVFDVTGAGDTVIATFAAFLATGKSLIEAVEWANYAAGCVVAKLGAACITPEELTLKQQQYTQPMKSDVLSLSEAKKYITIARGAGEKIVLTNGCFDILHAGHVHYLKQAKAFGDRLIVAVNDDASVARLKGDSRPINTLEQRMQVLAALEAVDWVIAFSEDTPLNVIKILSPDVLVKGGDYQVETIVGSDFVMTQGGQVKVLDFVDGLSTSKTIEKISRKAEMQES